MAISNEFLAITIAIAIFFLLSYSKIRWQRMAGTFGIIVFACTLVTIGDSIPMMVYFLACFAYGGIGLGKEVGELTSVI